MEMNHLNQLDHQIVGVGSSEKEYVMIEGIKVVRRADDDAIIFKSANHDWNIKYGEPSDWEDLADVKPGVKGEEAAAVVVAEGADDTE